jgi:hypothetical protein
LTFSLWSDFERLSRSEFRNLVILGNVPRQAAVQWWRPLLRRVQFDTEANVCECGESLSSLLLARDSEYGDGSLREGIDEEIFVGRDPDCFARSSITRFSTTHGLDALNSKN